MPAENPKDESPGSPQEQERASYYPATSTTWWEFMELAKRSGASDEAAAKQLYERYKEPILAQFKKYRFPDPEGACNEFFGLVFFPKLVEQAQRGKGRFRGFLGTVLRGFIIDRLRRRQRDPLNEAAEIDVEQGPEIDGGLREETFQAELDQGFSRLVVGRAYSKLGEQYARQGRAQEFEYCVGKLADTPLKTTAAALGTTEGNVKQLRSKARGRLRDALLKEVEDIASLGERELEMSYLMRIYRV